MNEAAVDLQTKADRHAQQAGIIRRLAWMENRELTAGELDAVTWHTDLALTCREAARRVDRGPGAGRVQEAVDPGACAAIRNARQRDCRAPTMVHEKP